LVKVDRLVSIIAIGYGIAAVAGSIFAITFPIWQALLVFWIGGAVATIVAAVVFKIWVNVTRNDRSDDHEFDTIQTSEVSANAASSPRFTSHANLGGEPLFGGQGDDPNFLQEQPDNFDQLKKRSNYKSIH
jgi:uncharacterized membrane protein YgaE (UPF0421/DUF939 family)